MAGHQGMQTCLQSFSNMHENPPSPSCDTPTTLHLLAPTLADVLTAVMNSEAVPGSIDLVLVTPCHKCGP